MAKELEPDFEKAVASPGNGDVSVLRELENGIGIEVVAKIMNLRSGVKDDRWWGSCRLAWLGGSTDIWFDREDDFRGVVEGSVYRVGGNGASSREKGIRFYPKSFEFLG